MGHKENVYVAIDHWSMSIGIDMLANSMLVNKQTTVILAIDRC